MNCHDKDFYSLISELERVGILNLEKVERALGGKFSLSSESAGAKVFSGRDVRLSDVQIESIEYRAPTTGSESNGPLLIMRISQGCVGRLDVMRRYRSLELADIPHGRSLSEEAVYSKAEPWGSLSFGFPEGSPDCLKTVILAGK